ncbi:hypothetical protein HK101_006595, partial [Irineochytrium annulatum]
DMDMDAPAAFEFRLFSTQAAPMAIKLFEEVTEMKVESTRTLEMDSDEEELVRKRFESLLVDPAVEARRLPAEPRWKNRILRDDDVPKPRKRRCRASQKRRLAWTMTRTHVQHQDSRQLTISPEFQTPRRYAREHGWSLGRRSVVRGIAVKEPQQRTGSGGYDGGGYGRGGQVAGA